MDTDNNKKITWSRSVTKKDAPNPSSTDANVEPSRGVNATIPVMEVTNTAAAYKDAQDVSSNSGGDIDSLKSEIEAALSGAVVPNVDPAQTIIKSRNDQVIDLEAPDQEIISGKDTREPISIPSATQAPVPTLPATSPFDQVAKDNHEALVSSLKQDIQSDLNKETGKEVKPAQSGMPTDTGIEQTYYSDLSNAMSSNEPATMSELIRKSRFEEKEKKALSPKSKKNIAFIVGAAVLLLLSIVIISTFFNKEKQIEFITEERVTSLVRSNMDTGINTTGLESARIKQAIRDVIELKIPEDNINQIYYVEGDGLGNLRRIGIKDIFDKTDNNTPPVLYDNIENTFTHGVYKTDKNYPFIIMNALSYDRAFEGMLEWEPTMIDDLATYLDLTPEATDRSLLKEGFEDDVVRNKNVRVARFLPREVDRRGILEILGVESLEESLIPAGSPDLDDEETDGEIAIDGEELSFWQRFLPVVFEAQSAYAQVDGTDFDDFIDGQSELDDLQIEKVCFEKLTGNRLSVELSNVTPNSQKYCFESYRCYRYSCFVGNSEVGLENSGTPGAICRDVIEEGPVYLPGDPNHSSSDYTGPNKSCYQYNDLLLLQNINSAALCFNKQGQYLPNYVPTGLSTNDQYDPDYVTCLYPQDRDGELCVGQNNEVYDPNGIQIPAGGPKYCFETSSELTNFDPDSEVGFDPNSDTQTICSAIENETIEGRQFLLQKSVQLRFFADIGQLLGLSNTDAGNLREVAYFLEQLALGEFTDIEIINRGTIALQKITLTLDVIERFIDSTGIPLEGEIFDAYNEVRRVIQVIQCFLGVGEIVWVNGDLIPQGVTFYAGYSGEEVLPIQQTLVAIGLMNIGSITGIVDIVTQDALSQLQLANSSEIVNGSQILSGLEVTGILDEPTLDLILNIVNEHNNIFGDTAIINDYLDTDETQFIAIGTYSDDVQIIQVLLYTEGYNITGINGLFDDSMCEAVQAYQEDEGLEISDDVTCQLSIETIESLNDIIRDDSLLGSGFILNDNGELEGDGTSFLQGVGVFEILYGPGVVDFEINTAEANSLNEGDVVLMYMFLDEKTILIARDQVVIDEVIKRRALEDIFE
ncbi:MAG: hypothetical protein ACJAU8_000220 [Candidatus Paceibacteria bacterium]|jgi:hypothetical protein